MSKDRKELLAEYLYQLHKGDPMTIKEVYEKYKKYDAILSNTEWANLHSIESKALFDLWQAVKEASE